MRLKKKRQVIKASWWCKQCIRKKKKKNKGLWVAFRIYGKKRLQSGFFIKKKGVKIRTQLLARPHKEKDSWIRFMQSRHKGGNKNLEISHIIYKCLSRLKISVKFGSKWSPIPSNCLLWNWLRYIHHRYRVLKGATLTCFINTIWDLINFLWEVLIVNGPMVFGETCLSKILKMCLLERVFVKFRLI